MPFQGVTVGDYCLYYECNNDAWALRAEACLCFNESKIQDLDALIPGNVNRCCPQVNFYGIQPSSEGKQGPILQNYFCSNNRVKF